MAGSDENNSGVIGASNFQGFRAGGHNRRALSTINQNVISNAPYPCAVNKRGLSEKPPLNRPITRKFAAQLASKEQKLGPECVRRGLRSEQNLNGSEDVTIIDVDEYDEDTSNFNAPMFVQHTKAMLDEIDQMEEVEMEDLNDEDPAMDIDDSDGNDPLAVVEYVKDLYKYYRKSEESGCVSPTYMTQQCDINERMRGILIDWLIEVHYKFELMEETLYLTVNLIDRFLAIQPVVRKKLQLVGVTAMLLACKYEEVSVPIVEDLILISDKAYSKKEVLDMEKLMANVLQFNMSVPTPYVFMRRFLKAAQSDKKLELLSFFLIELSMVEYEMLKFPPSVLAAAAIYSAQCSLNGCKTWSKTCSKCTMYSEEQLQECAKLMVTFHQNAATGKLTGVHRKYSTSKFGYTAKSQPALFLI